MQDVKPSSPSLQLCHGPSSNPASHPEYGNQRKMEALEYKSESDKDNQSPRKNGLSGAVERNTAVQARED